jgi:hypothetical protein
MLNTLGLLFVSSLFNTIFIRLFIYVLENCKQNMICMHMFFYVVISFF